MPRALVRLQNDLPAPRASCEMMAQSVAGLAAKAVNEGRADEMVWVGTDNIDIEDWFARLVEAPAATGTARHVCSLGPG